MFAWSSPGHWTNRPSMNMCRAPDIKSTFGNHLECIWEPDAPGCTCMHHPNRNHINGVSASSRKRLVSPPGGGSFLEETREPLLGRAGTKPP